MLHRRLGRALLAVGVLGSLALASGAGADPAECRRLAFTDREAGTNCYRGLLLDPSAHVQAEALWGLGDLAGANRAFRVAVEESPDDPDLRTRWGRLYLAAHKDADAEALFQEALALDAANVEAQVGLAEVAAGRFDVRARALAQGVLDRAPAHPGAHFVLARLALEVGDVEAARDRLRPVAEADEPGARLRAMALLAAADHLEGETGSPWTDRALSESPGYGVLFETIGHFYVIRRRYEQAVAMFERAVAIDPRLYTAHATLGVNLLRVNRFEDAQRHLALAWEGDPYDAEVVNTLRLLDSVREGFDLTEDERFVLRTHRDETGALLGYVRQLVQDGLRVMGERYGYVPEEPVAIELYPHHDDFAVRTSGLPGIGILGATFGDVVAMDSPSARGIDEGFDWASALWHELAHVVTLNATDNLVSRWFSEGVSVLEEWRTGPSASRSVPIDFIEAVRADRLLPVTDLDRGFMQPDFPGRVVLSYIQAGLLCEYIEETRGVAALAGVLRAYAAGEDTPGAVLAGLDTTPADLDAEFEAYLEERFEGIEPAAFRAAVEDAATLAKRGDPAGAVEAARAAVDLYPDYVGPNGPYPLLAEAEAELGDVESAIEVLSSYWRRGGRDPRALVRLVEWLTAAGRPAEALPVQRSLALVTPLSLDERRRLGDFLFDSGAHGEALTEYLAHLSLRPHDLADAQYRVARAYRELGQVAEARRHVLYALEIAPRFRAALSLLLEIEG